jgi:GcrA cell cycle regulator
MLTDEKKRLIEKMWGEHYTSGQIALAVGVTRSSVMGYVNRKKLLRNPGVKKKAKSDQPKKPERYIKLISIEGKLIRRRSVTITPQPKKNVKKTLMQLTPDSCRFILGEVQAENTIYCCQPISKGSYCEYHASLCYHPPKKAEKRERKRVSALVFRRPNTLVFKS